MIRRPPRSTLDRSSAASDVYKRQVLDSPVYGTEIGQTLAERPINEVCLYSGQTIVTPGQGTVADADSAPIQVGTQLLGLCSPAHAIYIESTLQNLEAAGQPVTTLSLIHI